MGRLRIFGRSGDEKVSWSLNNQAEIDAAKDSFDAYKRRGFTAFAVTRGNRQGARIEEFDLMLEEILFVPPMAGG